MTTNPHLREPRATDQSYIASTWVRSIAGRGDRPLGPRYGDLGRQVDAVMDRAETRALIRHAAHDKDAILGYVVFAEGVGVPLVHFCYVRMKHDGHDLRGSGIATALLSAIRVVRDKPAVCTSITTGDSRYLRDAYKLVVPMPLKEFLR